MLMARPSPETSYITVSVAPGREARPNHVSDSSSRGAYRVYAWSNSPSNGALDHAMCHQNVSFADTKYVRDSGRGTSRTKPTENVGHGREMCRTSSPSTLGTSEE